MRINETEGIYSMFEDLSPEVHRAQRLAELEQLARYRARRLAEYQAWSDPVQRMQIQINARVEEAKARAEVAGKTVYLPPRLKLEERIEIIPLKKSSPKRSWWRRLLRMA